jgi:hypothetical protein
MREPFAGCSIVALQPSPLYLDAWSEDEPVVYQGTPVVKCDLASHRVERCGCSVYQAYAITLV